VANFHPPNNTNNPPETAQGILTAALPERDDGSTETGGQQRKTEVVPTTELQLASCLPRQSKEKTKTKRQLESSLTNSPPEEQAVKEEQARDTQRTVEAIGSPKAS
jgi:hypothetical protein